MGCVWETLLAAYDDTELGLNPAAAFRNGYRTSIVLAGVHRRSQYRQHLLEEVPEGTELLAPHPRRNNPVSYLFRWIPKRFQEGFSYQVVFEARSYVDGMEVMGFGSTNQTNQILSLHVIRCRFCSTTDAKMVSALASMALQWRTSWLSIWSGNHLLVDAEDVSGTQIVLGPTLRVMPKNACQVGRFCGDTLHHTSARFQVPTERLLWWNPDIADEAAVGRRTNLQRGQEVCILPSICVDYHWWTA